MIILFIHGIFQFLPQKRLNSMKGISQFSFTKRKKKVQPFK